MHGFRRQCENEEAVFMTEQIRERNQSNLELISFRLQYFAWANNLYVLMQLSIIFTISLEWEI